MGKFSLLFEKQCDIQKRFEYCLACFISENVTL